MDKAYLDTSEIQRLEEAATNLRDRLLIRLLSRLGCRISEALSLTLEDIDLHSGAVTIEHLNDLPPKNGASVNVRLET